MPADPFSHINRLQDEAIHIIREAVAEAERPVLLYSIGKDSAVLLHLASKAFYPAKLPFPLLHIDTTWKFRAMYEHRDACVRKHKFSLIIHRNDEALHQGVSPLSHGSAVYTDQLKTAALKQALTQYGFDVAFGGARRDEEKSRAKERVFSLRNANHAWEPKRQRPEMWSLYNTRKIRGDSLRVFPLSNWTELDVWRYIKREGISVPSLYFSAKRPVVVRAGALIMVDDDRLPLGPGETPEMRNIRFRSLGCYPLTGAIESDAKTLDAIIAELTNAAMSEREGRLIDTDQEASMEKKKQEGYF